MDLNVPLFKILFLSTSGYHCAAKCNAAKIARGCTLTNKQTSEARIDGYVGTFESRKSIHVDNKQACPRVSHLALTNNCGEFLFARVAALANKCILHSVEFSRREASRTMCSPNPTIVLQITR